ncbi:MAG: S1 family peptidase [Myxococcales bacterium]|nr:S1 family peptidase [Myxococcales bacterium]
MDVAASRTLVGLIIAGAGASTVASTARAEGDLRAPTPVTPIVGGEVTDSGDFDGVVALQAGNGLCSGTVVAPRLILTAAHCLANLGDNEQVIVHYGDEINQGTVAATNWAAHPRFCPDCKEDLFDYGYVELGTDFNVPGGYTLPIATQVEWDEAMAEGEAITLVGFGEDPDAVGGSAGIGVKRQVDTTIRRLSDAGLEFYAGGDHRDSCNGDSGGPAFVRVASGAIRLAGITSRGSNPCGDGGYYGAPYPALCWVRDETGVDFVGGACANCDCIDTSPPDEDSKCGVAPSGRGDDLRWLAALVVIPLGRRILRRRAGR